jgi:hypothetical protein
MAIAIEMTITISPASLFSDDLFITTSPFIVGLIYFITSGGSGILGALTQPRKGKRWPHLIESFN